MCGIAGIIDSNGQLGDAAVCLKSMAEAMEHRGPDNISSATIELPGSGRVHLGHARLKVIDLSEAANQPMESERSALVYNGETYNYLRIGEEFGLTGLNTHCDTEVILRLLEAKGTGAISLLDGMFALAFIDKQTGQVTLARDRFGMKPLYFAKLAGGVFIFASEIRALMASGLVERSTDSRAVAEYLTYGHAIGARTLIDNVQMLAPGHQLQIKPGGAVEITRFGDVIEDVDIETDQAVAGDTFRNALSGSVRDQLVSDVPLGVFLSGGLDSSIVAALASSAQSGVRTLSLVFPEVYKVDNEYSSMVARHFGTEHREIALTRRDFSDSLMACLGSFDCPSYDGINTYFVSRAAREDNLTVCLSGLGGDEYFGGYYTSRLFGIVDRHRGLLGLHNNSIGRLSRAFLALGKRYGKSGIWHLADRLSSLREFNAAEAYLSLVEMNPSEVTAALLGLAKSEIKQIGRAAFDFLPADEPVAYSSAAECDTHLFMMDQLLRDGDQMAMAHSLEVRFPMLGIDVNKAARAMPPDMRFAAVPSKRALYDLFADLLPAELASRPKEGFSLPMREWVLDQGNEMLRDLARGQAARGFGISAEVVDQLLDRFHLQGSAVKWGQVWSLVVLLSWGEQNIAGGRA